MNARVAADKRPIVHSESVRVARVGSEVHRLQHLAGCGIVLDQARPAFGVVFAIVSSYLPDGAVIPRHGVVPHPARSLVERDHEFRLPCRGIDPKKSTESQRSDPELAFVPHSPVAAASVIGGAERDLTMADDF